MDALGPSIPYQAYLSSLFPTLSITVKPKADSLYTIVGAASVAAKVTRDAWIKGWVYEEGRPCPAIARAELDNVGLTNAHPLVKGGEVPMGSGYPSGEILPSSVAAFLTLTVYCRSPNSDLVEVSAGTDIWFSVCRPLFLGHGQNHA